MTALESRTGREVLALLASAAREYGQSIAMVAVFSVLIGFSALVAAIVVAAGVLTWAGATAGLTARTQPSRE